MEKSNTKEFINKANNIHNNFYLYGKTIYVRAISLVIITCPVHGDFNQKPHDHLLGKGCYNCFIDRVSSNINKFIEKSNIIHDYFYDYSKTIYIRSISPVIITCPIHGDFSQTPLNHYKNGCQQCYGNQTLTTQIFIDRANILHGYFYDYSKTIYVSGRDKVIITCPIHGDFEQMARSHLQKHGCSRCQNKYKETKWIKSFNNSNILTNQIIIENGKIYKPDGINGKNIYEFYGDFWHGNPKIFKPEDLNYIRNQTFGYLYNRTVERENELKSAGYNLITIWETDFDKL